MEALIYPHLFYYRLTVKPGLNTAFNASLTFVFAGKRWHYGDSWRGYGKKNVGGDN